MQGCSPESDAADIVTWALEPKGNFTTKSLYRFLTDWGMPSSVAGVIWKCKIPLKIKVFFGNCFTTSFRLQGTWLKGGGKVAGAAAYVAVLKLSIIFSLIAIWLNLSGAYCKTFLN